MSAGFNRVFYQRKKKMLHTKNKELTPSCNLLVFFYFVGMTRFELATTGPPDRYSKPD